MNNTLMHKFIVIDWHYHFQAELASNHVSMNAKTLAFINESIIRISTQARTEGGNQRHLASDSMQVLPSSENLSIYLTQRVSMPKQCEATHDIVPDWPFGQLKPMAEFKIQNSNVEIRLILSQFMLVFK